MAIRTTDELVREIIELEDTDVITPFIALANDLVDEICEPLGYTETRLMLIETWLAAHFTAVKLPRLTSESAGGVSESYQTSPGMGLDLTPYGQQVKMLDTKGGLAKLDKDTKAGTKSVATMFWAGTVPGEET
jgi:hypothetical protein